MDALRLRLDVTAALLVAAAAGALVVAGRTSRSVSAQAAVRRIDDEVSTLLAGIPPHGNTLGHPTAPFTLAIFGDLQRLTVKNRVVFILLSIIHFCLH